MALLVVDPSIKNTGTSKKAEGDLRKAVINGQLDRVYFLLQSGVDKDVGDPDNKWTPLHLAALHGWPDVAKLLCEAGADMECRSFRQNTPLHVAVWASTGDELPASGRSLATPSSRNVAVARVLLAQGANKEAANYRLNRPLHIVAGNHQMDPEMARVLISAGSNKDCKNYDGNTPLHCAAAEGFDEVARLLLVAGAGAEVQSASHSTAFHIAAKLRRPGVVELLLRFGASFDEVEDKEGMTPHDYAKKNVLAKKISTSSGSSRGGSGDGDSSAGKQKHGRHCSATEDARNAEKVLALIQATLTAQRPPVWMPQKPKRTTFAAVGGHATGAMKAAAAATAAAAAAAEATE